MRYRPLSAGIASLLLATVAEAQPPAIPFEKVALNEAKPLHWEKRTKGSLENTRIEGDLSIQLEECTDITITACDLRAIELSNCQRITFRNCWIHDSKRVGIQTYQCREITVEGCRFENVSSGLYAMESQTIRFIGNFSRNVLGPFPRGQMIQLNQVTGGNLIQGNYAINDRGRSHPEDVINLYKSSGEEASPIVVEGNYLTGDPTAGSEGKSATGSGIMLGDCGGGYITCRHNVVLDAGQCGIGVAGGHFIRVEDNLIVGRKSNVSNIGLYVWNQSHEPSDHIAILGNRAHWTDAKGQDSTWWNGGGAQQVEEKDNHFYDTDLHWPPPPSRAPTPPHPWIKQQQGLPATIPIPWTP